jgi:DNA-binding HxlR family transcriptional regulator
MVSEDVRELIGRKRTVEILELLNSRGTLNYSEIESSVNSSSDTISDALSLLSQHDLVKRTERGPHDVRYELTNSGKELVAKVSEIEDLLEE